ncbi:bacteriohemerythrin [Janthinobacterium fluminis]|uniref:Hemerythrin family protein n=1 Tax=Janthinobacterium fluminis TaxID=2987524 RepID=A0ABT5JZR8_9BURK|nr:hemerythrin family protein [Janthinobacterium fluminis]MDC8756987.1 hemerythrin family protein [Janthinobacterium fluminis]
MHAIRWSEDMALGVPTMDQAHQALLAQLERLIAAPDEHFAAAYCELIATLEADFREEEQLMEKINFPARRRHSEQHARVLNGLRHADADVRQGDMAAGRDVVRMLPRWFLGHLSSMDLELAVALELAGEHHQRPPDVLLRAQLSRMLKQNMMESTRD